jgi:hypothetical protein
MHKEVLHVFTICRKAIKHVAEISLSGASETPWFRIDRPRELDNRQGDNRSRAEPSTRLANQTGALAWHFQRCDSSDSRGAFSVSASITTSSKARCCMTESAAA